MTQRRPDFFPPWSCHSPSGRQEVPSRRPGATAASSASGGYFGAEAAAAGAQRSLARALAGPGAPGVDP